ncbi:hypothetical protein GCM10025868_30970 [Angustibacter aerolatus]|uniref:Uncharacterized protein n=1 Tax=Angustibacter aerolatus TaxID=1162965 RepID=A0ABQ6JJA4_9ACTN|nr:hypothetical protein GCM10025868_30970 [Angustibacter aerolatus]
MCDENTVPSVAMPVAMPTWRNVELAPEAMPDRCGGTTPTAVDASGTLIRPVPTPATSSPGSRWVHSVVVPMPRISSSPAATSRNPGPMSALVGTCDVSRPATIAVRNTTPENGSVRRPVCSGV